MSDFTYIIGRAKDPELASVKKLYEHLTELGWAYEYCHTPSSIPKTLKSKNIIVVLSLGTPFPFLLWKNFFESHPDIRVSLYCETDPTQSQVDFFHPNNFLKLEDINKDNLELLLEGFNSNTHSTGTNVVMAKEYLPSFDFVKEKSDEDTATLLNDGSNKAQNELNVNVEEKPTKISNLNEMLLDSDNLMDIIESETEVDKKPMSLQLESPLSLEESTSYEESEGSLGTQGDPDTQNELDYKDNDLMNSLIMDPVPNNDNIPLIMGDFPPLKSPLEKKEHTTKLVSSDEYSDKNREELYQSDESVNIDSPTMEIPAAGKGEKSLDTMRGYISLKEKEIREKDSALSAVRKQLERVREAYEKSEDARRQLTLKLEESENNCRSLEDIRDQHKHNLDKIQTSHQDEMRNLQIRIDNLQYQNLRSEKKLEEFRERVRVDILKIRMRERELYNKLELQKRDAEALLAAKDERLLQQKRDLDRFEFETENLKERLLEETKNAEDRSARLSRALQSLKMAQVMLSGMEEEVLPGAKDEDKEDKVA